MLTRVYINNFRCFVNFEWKPGRRQLIMGGNGTGKSTLMEALLRLRQFVAGRQRVDEIYRLQQRTRWFDQPEQTFEIEAAIDGVDFVYRLVLTPDRSPDVRRFLVSWEALSCGGRPLVEFAAGQVRRYNDDSVLAFQYPASPDRSVLPSIPAGGENPKLDIFRDWLLKSYCFRIDPFEIDSLARGEAPFAEVGLSNFSAWYRRLLQNLPRENAVLMDDLRGALDGFSYLFFEPQGEDTSLLVAEFTGPKGESVKFAFNELSEGQRCLVCLYAILRFILDKGYTVVLDEPDNFLALREIQPWLTAAEDAIEDHRGQLLVISHHPEFINQWAPELGVQFAREGVGPVSVRGFRVESGTTLPPAELVARGWDLE